MTPQTERIDSTYFEQERGDDGFDVIGSRSSAPTPWAT